MTTSRDPFALFLDAHEEIREALATLQHLAGIESARDTSETDRVAARGLEGFLERSVLPHHREEEREFWPLVARADATPDERSRFTLLAQRLQSEHEDLERRWVAVERTLNGMASGRGDALDGSALRELAERYREHARLEDEVLVPLAQHLLAPTEQTRLAVSVLLSRLPAGQWGMV